MAILDLVRVLDVAVEQFVLKAAIQFSITMNPLLSAFCLALGVTSALPLCSETIAVAGGGPPNSGLPSLVSKATIKELQLALFLENLESAFYSAGSSNIAGWGVYGYPNDTVGVVSKIAAVSQDALKCGKCTQHHYSKKPYMLQAFRISLLPITRRRSRLATTPSL